jgi:predicted DNA-binding transcriptional regulator AlpA
VHEEPYDCLLYPKQKGTAVFRCPKTPAQLATSNSAQWEVLSEPTMRSVTENSSSQEMSIAPDTTLPIEKLETRGDASKGRELRPIAIHGIERFIDAGKAAEFVQLNRKTLLRFAREGSIPAHPLTGNKRRKWRFLISELDAWARGKINSTSDRCQDSRRE